MSEQVNPFESIPDDNSNNPFEAMLNQAAKTVIFQETVGHFRHAISRCMRESGVNLESAIKMGREVLEHEAELPPLAGMSVEPEAEEMLTKAFEKAAVDMRGMLIEAYTLVRLNDTGAKEPLPYDPAAHFEERAAMEAQLRAARAQRGEG